MKSKLKKLLKLPHFAGKAVGLVLGFLLGSWQGAALGIILGHSFDFHRNKIFALVRRIASKVKLPKSRESVYRETLFICLGYVAKQNGRISPQEIAATEALFKRLNLNTVQREAAIAQFNQGKMATDSIEARLEQLRKRFANKKQYRLDFIDHLMNMAYAGGPASDSQLKLLHSFLPLLNISQGEFDRLHQLIREHKGYSSQQTYQQSKMISKPVLLQAYKTLGLTKTASPEEIKLSYRKLMSIHHPDKLIAQGLTERALEKGKEKAQDIQQAYSVLKKSRGL
ncbi:MAG TPA: co-chaperone DjlA [Marinospirillum sp.]|uniref:co-chaperone DjlA n=1 Tax=Marinospirillum sp. TaxID=2183934 RepID=UPI002B49B855|nr:co-chaperone DjlA [Marinospirillum sp.]HKM14949.1 co-chaperone DjlA [Marinospirillum sp.]